MRMATFDLLRRRQSQWGALLVGVLLGAGTGALAGWPIGLGVGCALAGLLLMQSFMPRLAARDDVAHDSAPTPIAPDGVEIYRVSDPLLIDRASTVLETLGAIGRRPGVLILDLTGLDWIDATALRIIHQTLERGSQSGALVLVAGCRLLTTELTGRSGGFPSVWCSIRSTTPCSGRGSTCCGTGATDVSHRDWVFPAPAGVR